jgi:hypothetical protein
MYDIIGNVVDEQNRPISGVNVDDGSKETTTDGFGYYELKTDKKKINFKRVGFLQESFDLSKYKDGSKINVDITLKTDTESTTLKPFEIIEKRNPVVVQEKGLTKKQMRNIGLGMIGIALILSSILLIKALKK